MSSYPYDSTHEPPIPSCDILLGAGGTEPSLGPLPAIIDTGADITVVPLAYIRQLDARPISVGTARSLWGDRRPVEIFALSLRIGGLLIRAHQVLADASGDEIILGRTVLNRLYLILDGPAALTDLVEQRAI